MDEQLLCPCEFQLVLCYNKEPGELSAREIEPEVLADILLGLNKNFGDYTPLGIAGKDGMPGGTWQGDAEASVRIEVAVLPERVDELEQYVVEIGVRLKQKAMYFKRGAPCVKIIDIEQRKSAEGGK